MNDRFRISPSVLARLTDQGVVLEDAARRAGLPGGFLRQDPVTATTQELFAFWRGIGESSGDPGLGLAVGSEQRLEHYNATAIAAVCSRSFRDAIGRLARYKQLTCPEAIRLEVEGREASVEFRFLEARTAEPPVLVDLCLAWIHSVGRRGTDGRIRAQRLELAREDPGDGLHAEHFGCTVTFGAERNALVFRDLDLDVPFVTHNHELLSVVRGPLEAELRDRATPPSVSEQVKQTLRRSLAGRRPTLADVARELCVSSRTLQRRLTEAGVSFQSVLEETRRELAREYLAKEAIEITEAAYLLGYGDTNSFFRAFRAWEGTSPGQYRTALGVGGAATQ